MRFVLSAPAVFAGCLLVCGCSQNAATSSHPPARVAQAPGNAAPNAGEAAAVPQERKIVYTCQVEVVVVDLNAAVQRLNSLIESVHKHGGYLSRQELSGTSGAHRAGRWTVRVPLTQFDGFVAEVEKLGELQRNSRDAQDVTDSYTDLEARLRNKQASEQRLLGHLEKSSQLKDTLELEREISRVRGEVEQLQGQLNLLKSKTELATVNVTIFERPGYTPPAKLAFMALIGRTFQESLNHLIGFGQIAALITVALAPWAVTALLPLLIIWQIQKRVRLRTSGN